MKMIKIIGVPKLKCAKLFCENLLAMCEQGIMSESWIVSVCPLPNERSFEFWYTFARNGFVPSTDDILRVFNSEEKIVGVLTLDMLSTPRLSYAGACGKRETTSENLSPLIQFIKLIRQIGHDEQSLIPIPSILGEGILTNIGLQADYKVWLEDTMATGIQGASVVLMEVECK